MSLSTWTWDQISAQHQFTCLLSLFKPVFSQFSSWLFWNDPCSGNVWIEDDRNNNRGPIIDFMGIAAYAWLTHNSPPTNPISSFFDEQINVYFELAIIISHIFSSIWHFLLYSAKLILQQIRLNCQSRLFFRARKGS